jgi:hypothetical protein
MRWWSKPEHWNVNSPTSEFELHRLEALARADIDARLH